MSDAAETAPKGAGKGGKFLTFFLGDEEYGVEILKVQEIIGMMPVTHVPRTPAFILGVVNLRGKIIPVIDLRLKLDMPPAPRTERTCVVVTRANGMEIGVVVDRVSEVADVAAEDIEETPPFAAGADTEYIMGIGKSQSKVRLLLDIDRALSKADMEHIGALGAARESAEKTGGESRGGGIL